MLTALPIASGRAAGLVGLVLVALLASAAPTQAAEGPRGEVETVCSGGQQTVTGTAYSASAARSFKMFNGAVPISCPFAAPAGSVIRFYGTKSNPGVPQRYALSNGQSVDVDAYGNSAQQALLASLTATSDVIGATASGLSSSTAVFDFYTVEEPTPTTEPTPTPTTEPTPTPTTEPTPTPSPTPTPTDPVPVASVVELNEGQFGAVVLALALVLLMLSALLVAQLRRPS